LDFSSSIFDFIFHFRATTSHLSKKLCLTS